MSKFLTANKREAGVQIYQNTMLIALLKPVEGKTDTYLIPLLLKGVLGDMDCRYVELALNAINLKGQEEKPTGASPEAGQTQKEETASTETYANTCVYTGAETVLKQHLESMRSLRVARDSIMALSCLGSKIQRLECLRAELKSHLIAAHATVSSVEDFLASVQKLLTEIDSKGN